NSCKKVPEEWRRHFNYIIVNNLEDVSTDEPLYGMSNTVSPLPSKQLIIDEAIALAFIMCVSSREVLSGRLLDTEIAKIINK
ncbi:4464_t:CDS:2, partial [Gigaspora rosea]